MNEGSQNRGLRFVAFLSLRGKFFFQFLRQMNFNLVSHLNYFGEIYKIYFEKLNTLLIEMEKLHIKGTIASAGDLDKNPKEAYFSYNDLESFLEGREDSGPFLAVIDSPGGSVDEGFKIYGRLKEEGADTLAIRANSIASVIFAAGKKRYVSPAAEIIIHNAWVDPEDLSGEKLNYHSAKMLTDYFAETDAKILSVYTEHAGEEKAAELLAFMAVDKNLGADKALEIGLATDLTEEEEPAQNVARKVVTYSKNFIELINQNKEEQMKTEEKIGAFEKLLKGLAKAFKLNVKNMTVTTTEGVELYVSGEGELVGSAAFIAEEGLPTETPAPAGSHTLTDGTVITVGEGGVITEAILPESMDEIKAAYEEEKEKALALEQEKKELEAKVVALTAEAEENKKNLASLQTEFLNLKNEVLGDPEKKDKKPEALSAEEFKKLTPMEKIRMAALNKASN